MTIHKREEEMRERMVGDAMVQCLPFLDFTVVRVENRTDRNFPGATCIGVWRSAQYGTFRQQAGLMSADIGACRVACRRVEVDRRE